MNQGVTPRGHQALPPILQAAPVPGTERNLASQHRLQVGLRCEEWDVAGPAPAALSARHKGGNRRQPMRGLGGCFPLLLQTAGVSSGKCVNRIREPM